MNRLILASLFALLATGHALATSHEHGMSHHQMATQATTQHSTGILKAVNAAAGKVQIAHDPIPALGWPAMTMWFAMQSPLPDNLKTGDKVRFEMVQPNAKQWVIVKIRRE